MTDAFILGVPTVDDTDLTALTDQIGSPRDFAKQRYFDGAAFIEALVPTALSAAAWATLRGWIRARADVQKATRITIDGIEMTAISATDAVRLITALAERVSVQDDDK